VSARPENFGDPAIRPMGANDLDAVVAIEERAYEFPWSRGIFSDCLLAGYYCAVLVADGVVSGYAIMSVAAAEGHILHLCVENHLRQRGLGRQLLNFLLSRVKAANMERLFLEVRPSNAAAIALYDSAGFTRLGTRKGYYKAREGREDALVFVLELRGAQQ